MKNLVSEILSKASSQSINSCVNSCLSEFDNIDWQAQDIFLAIAAQLRAENDTLTKSHNAILKNQLTEDQEKFDDSRDALVSGIGMCLRTFILSPIEKIANAAKRIKEIYDAQGDGLARQSYNDETAGIVAYLTEMKEEAFAAFVLQVPGLAQYHSLLEEQNNEFVRVFNKSKSMDSAADDQIWPGEQKKVVRDLMNKKFIPYLNVMADMDPNAFEKYAGTVSELIEKVNTQVRSTYTRKQTQKEEIGG